jgi:hypothetical protein
LISVAAEAYVLGNSSGECWIGSGSSVLPQTEMDVSNDYTSLALFPIGRTIVSDPLPAGTYYLHLHCSTFKGNVLWTRTSASAATLGNG